MDDHNKIQAPDSGKGPYTAYIGYIEERQLTHITIYDFYAVAILGDDTISPLPYNDACNVFPAYGNVLWGKSNERRFPSGVYKDRELYVMRITAYDLKKIYEGDSGASRTQFRINVGELNKKGQILSLNKAGLYPVLKPKGNIQTPFNVIDTDNIQYSPGRNCVLLEEDGLLYGPYWTEKNGDRLETRKIKQDGRYTLLAICQIDNAERCTRYPNNTQPVSATLALLCCEMEEDEAPASEPEIYEPVSIDQTMDYYRTLGEDITARQEEIRRLEETAEGLNQTIAEASLRAAAVKTDLAALKLEKELTEEKLSRIQEDLESAGENLRALQEKTAQAEAVEKELAGLQSKADAAQKSWMLSRKSCPSRSRTW